MPEIRITTRDAEVIRKWAGRIGNQITSSNIDAIGSLHVIGGEPLLIRDGSFLNIGGVAEPVSHVFTSEGVARRMKEEGVQFKPIPEKEKSIPLEAKAYSVYPN